jgi:hypothetical protein
MNDQHQSKLCYLGFKIILSLEDLVCFKIAYRECVSIIYHNLQWKKEYLVPSVFVVLFIKYFLVCYSITNSFRWDPSNIKIAYYKTTKNEVLLFLLQNQTYMLHCLAIRHILTQLQVHIHISIWTHDCEIGHMERKN